MGVLARRCRPIVNKDRDQRRRLVDAGLLVIGAQHRRFADTTVAGTTTERITRYAKHAVMTVIRKEAAAKAAAA